MGVFDKLFGKKNHPQENMAPVNENTVPEKAEPKATEPKAAPTSSVNTDVDDKYIEMLRNYARRFIPGSVENAQTAKKLLENIGKVIETVNPDLLSPAIQKTMETGELGELPIHQFNATVAYEVNKWIEVTNMPKIVDGFAAKSHDELFAAWIALDFLAYNLKPEYSVSIKRAAMAIAKELKKRGVEFRKEEVSEFVALQRRCNQLEKENPKSDELLALKKQLGEKVLELDAIWVAFDGDFSSTYPHIGLMGKMEIFTKEEYALAAKQYFASIDEGRFEIRKIEKADIAKFFDDTLYMGGTVFNLDNGVHHVELRIEGFFPYKDDHIIDRNNRDIRCYLIRYLQGFRRYHNISAPGLKEKQKEVYQNVLNVLMSNGFTALANSLLYVLSVGPYMEDISFYSQKAYDRYKEVLAKKNIKAEDAMIAPGTKKSGVMKNIPGIETLQFPNKGRLAAVFTDRYTADSVRQKFKSFGAEHDPNIVVMTFEEVLENALKCDGLVVDPDAYGYAIDKAQLEGIKAQLNKNVK